MPDASHVHFAIGSLTELVAVVLIFGTPVIIVSAILSYRWRRARQLNETIVRLAEKGLPIPPELFVEVKTKGKSPLRTGVILVAVGAGLVCFSASMYNEFPWGIGMIPLLMGIGYLIVWKLENRD